jgi:hypothetical protein
MVPDIASMQGVKKTSRLFSDPSSVPCTRVYQIVSGLAARSEKCKWYSSLPLDAVVSLFGESV